MSFMTSSLQLMVRFFRHDQTKGDLAPQIGVGIRIRGAEYTEISFDELYNRLALLSGDPSVMTRRRVILRHT